MGIGNNYLKNGYLDSFSKGILDKKEPVKKDDFGVLSKQETSLINSDTLVDKTKFEAEMIAYNNSKMNEFLAMQNMQVLKEKKQASIGELMTPEQALALGLGEEVAQRQQEAILQQQEGLIVDKETGLILHPDSVAPDVLNTEKQCDLYYEQRFSEEMKQEIKVAKQESANAILAFHEAEKQGVVGDELKEKELAMKKASAEAEILYWESFLHNIGITLTPEFEEEIEQKVANYKNQLEIVEKEIEAFEYQKDQQKVADEVNQTIANVMQAAIPVEDENITMQDEAENIQAYWNEQENITSKAIENLTNKKYIKAWTDNKGDSKDSAINGLKNQLTKFISKNLKVDYPKNATSEEKARVNAKAIAKLIEKASDFEAIKKYFGKDISQSQASDISEAVLEFITSIMDNDNANFNKDAMTDSDTKNDFQYKKNGSINKKFGNVQQSQVSSAQRGTITPMGQDIVDEARKYIGYNSTDGSAQIFITNGKNIKDVAWCSEFASYAIRNSGQYDNVADWYKNCNQNAAKYISKAAKEANAIVSASEAGPGDLLLFDRDRDGVASHTALIKKIENGRVYTIERVGNEVKEKSYSIEEMGNKLMFCKITQ